MLKSGNGELRRSLFRDKLFPDAKRMAESKKTLGGNSVDLTPDVNLDYYGWLVDQVKALQSRQYSRLDFDALAEELEAMAASQRRELKSRLHVLLYHLLKWQTQPAQREFRGRGWIQSIREARRQIKDLINDSPSLKYRLEELQAEVWEWACEDASDDVPLETFPARCPWAYDEFMSHNFLPPELSSNI